MSNTKKEELEQLRTLNKSFKAAQEASHLKAKTDIKKQNPIKP
jgi:hypothetical protein